MSLLVQIPEFLRYIRFEKRMSPHSVTAYQTDLAQFQDYLFTQFALDESREIKHTHIRSWIADMSEKGISPQSLQRKISTLKSFFKYLLRIGALAVNPTAQVHGLKVPKRLPVYLEEEQTEKITDALQYTEGWEGETRKLIIEILYQTGIRRSELIQLKEEDISFSRAVIHVMGKRNKERQIPVSQELLKAMQAYMNEKRKMFPAVCSYLLVLKSGAQLYPKYVYEAVRKQLTCLTTLQKKSPHVLRHTFATQLSNNGAELNAIKELLGHSSLAATQIYTHNNIERLKEVYRKTHPKS